MFGLGCISFDSYIKPQQSLLHLCVVARCISFDSYIKPQPVPIPGYAATVVYLLIPTSNHNFMDHLDEGAYVVYLLIPTSNHNAKGGGVFEAVVVYLLIPTSNHNYGLSLQQGKEVVYLLIPTSNHNQRAHEYIFNELYIFWFLHQTTTGLRVFLFVMSCISFDSYIKPQPDVPLWCQSRSCISFDSYIKPQLYPTTISCMLSCISFDSYIKPQPCDW